VRVWWTQESQAASPAGDVFDATLEAAVPVGREYYFVFLNDAPLPKRSIIKTAAVLEVAEL
jgi:hypothetical protein